MTEAAEAPAAEQASDDDRRLSGDASVVMLWTLVSRITGFVRIAAAGAVLGPTILSNVYQSTTVLPNIAYNLLAGSLIVSLVVPAVVGHLERGDTRSAARLANSFLGVMLAVSAAVGLVLLLATPLIARLLSVGAGDDVGPETRRAVAYLLVLVVPQIACYGLASVGMAVQNARQRFGLAAAAPAVENLVAIASVVLFAAMGGGLVDIDNVTTAQLTLLGLGNTAAVVTHAVLQWWGAARAGVVLRPQMQWDHPELRALVRRSGPAVANAVAQALAYFVLILAANLVPGGVIAVQLAAQMTQLPVALGARPVTVALLPRLSLRRAMNDHLGFLTAYREGVWLVGLTALPAAAGLVALAPSIAAVISVGRMSSEGAVALVEVSLVALALSVLGITLAEVGRVVLFADGDYTTPAVASWIQVGVVLVGSGLAITIDEPVAMLAALGSASTLGTLVAGVIIQRRALRSIRSGWLLATTSARTAAITVVAIGLTGLWTRAVEATISVPALPLLAVGGSTGLALYGVLQYRYSAAFRRVIETVARPARALRPRLAPDDAMVVAGLGLLVVLNAMVVVVGWLVPLGIVALVVFVLVWRTPALATYLYVASVPFLAGMERGALVPQARPNEAVLAGLVGILMARGMWEVLLGRPLTFRPNRLDLALITFTGLGTAYPILWLLARGMSPESGDLLEPVVLVRLLMIYGMVRVTITTAEQIQRVITISLLAAGLVAVVAVVQGTGLLAAVGGEPLLLTFWGPADVLNTGRASATLASSLATGGYLAYSLALAVAWWGARPRTPELSTAGTGDSSRFPPAPAYLGPLAVLLFLGAMASGQFSSWLAVLIAGPVAAWQVGRLWPLMRLALPVTPVVVLAAFPVLAGRLSEFAGPFGLPRSWIGRIDNLTTFYLPPLLDGQQWILGVRPNSVLQAPEQWREEIFLESGYLWLFWVGGIPFFLAFVWLVVEAFRSALSARRTRPHPMATTTGATAVAALACLLAMTLLDKHIQLRGAGDLFMILLPLTLIGLSRPAGPDPEPEVEPRPESPRTRPGALVSEPSAPLRTPVGVGG